VLYDATGREIERGNCPQSRLRLALPTSGRYILRTEKAGAIPLIRQ
jgi:hypothetical protein